MGVYSDDPELDAALCEDAAYLESIGEDPGLTLAQAEELDGLIAALESALGGFHAR